MFNIGDYVRFTEQSVIQDIDCEDVFLALRRVDDNIKSPKDIVGVIVIERPDKVGRLGVDFGPKFKRGGHTLFSAISTTTGYYVNKNSLEYAYGEYDPNSEPEDDCL